MRTVWLVLFILSLGIVWFFLSLQVHARDLGQWTAVDPKISHWFQSLMQPDAPSIPCCGEGDAYWADDVRTGPDGQLYAVITDDRPDQPLGRMHIGIGTEIPVPNNKIKYDQGNPTGHTVIFVGPTGHVYCYVQNGGV